MGEVLLSELCVSGRSVSGDLLWLRGCGVELVDVAAVMFSVAV